MSRRPPQPPRRPPGRPNPPPAGERAQRGAGQAVALSIVGVLVFAALAVLFVAILGRSPAATVSPLGIRLAQATPTQLPPEPVLESAPGVTAEFVRSREEGPLTSYGYIDKNAGIVHIPIDQAMSIVAKQGLPSRPANAQTAQDEGLTLPSYPSSGRYPEAVLH